MLPTYLQGVHDEARIGKWVTRLRGLARGDFPWPVLDAEQKELVGDLLVGFRAFTLSKWDRIPASVWPRFYEVLSDGVPRDQIMRAESHLAKVSEWLHDKYPVRPPLNSLFSPD